MHVKNGYTRIDSIEDLQKSCANKDRYYRLNLNFGLYSRKTIRYSTSQNLFLITNHIDNTDQNLDPQELVQHTNIMEGIKAGAFWQEPYKPSVLVSKN